MSFKRNLYNPEARKAEAEMREREAIKDAAYESFALVEKLLAQNEACKEHTDASEVLGRLAGEAKVLIAKVKGGK